MRWLVFFMHGIRYKHRRQTVKGQLAIRFRIVRLKALSRQRAMAARVGISSQFFNEASLARPDPRTRQTTTLLHAPSNRFDARFTAEHAGLHGGMGTFDLGNVQEAGIISNERAARESK